MDLEKLKPWNWFKHEEGGNGRNLPVSKAEVERPEYGAPGSLAQLHRDMDRWFDEAFKSFGMPSMAGRIAAAPMPGTSMADLFRPQIDVSGDNDGYQVSLDVPGLTEDDLSLEIRDDLLVIKGRKTESSEDRNRQYYRVERSFGAFQRTLTLPDDADADGIRASLDKGVLRLDIPRRAEARKDVRRIPISS